MMTPFITYIEKDLNIQTPVFKLVYTPKINLKIAL